MRNVFICFFFLMFIAGCNKQNIPNIIFDTDFGGDVDDLGALVMLNHFVAKHECRLLGIMVWNNEKYAVPAIDAVNKYYGNNNIPIGVRKAGSYVADWNYSKSIADHFPHSLTYESAPEVTYLYRKILSKQPCKSVTLVTVGPLMNIQLLLQSQPDSISPLSGMELFHSKVKEMVVMGGAYPEGHQEWNFWGEMKGVTKFVFENISVPVVFVGYEIGVVIKTGDTLNYTHKNTPLYFGFKHFSQHAPWMKDKYVAGKITENASYDQTAILYAVKGGVGSWWDKIEGGKNQIDSLGNNKWVVGQISNHSYLKLKENPENLAKLITKLMLFSPKP
jgi:inosine-uridine nucleoside N-ribohydrolase